MNYFSIWKSGRYPGFTRVYIVFALQLRLEVHKLNLTLTFTLFAQI